MEFGASSDLVGDSSRGEESGRGRLVGVSWASASTAMEGNLLVVTAESRVDIFASEDRRLLTSWLTRLGSYNRFTVAAVHNRAARLLACVQNGTRLFLWRDHAASLDEGTRVKLASPAFGVRTSRAWPIFAVIGFDATVTVLDVRGATVASWAPPASAEAAAGAPRADAALAREVAWARMTALPGEPSRHVLLLLQQPVGDSGSGGDAAPRLFTLTLTASIEAPASATAGVDPAAAPTTTYSLAHVATHDLRQEPAVGGGVAAQRVLAANFHKYARALSLVWSDGSLTVYNYVAPAVGSKAAALWFAGGLRVLWRHALRTTPHAFSCASFALGPSCMVLAAPAPAGGTITLSVWDVRYGVVLSTKALDLEAAAAAPTASPSGAVNMPLQVLVSEDNAFIATVSSRRLVLTDVAVRGASLVAAVGQAAATRPLLRADDPTVAAVPVAAGAGAAIATASLALHMPLAALLHGCDSTPDARHAWAHAVDVTTAAVRADTALLADHSATPTALAVAAVLRNYSPTVYSDASLAEAATAGTRLWLLQAPRRATADRDVPAAVAVAAALRCLVLMDETSRPEAGRKRRREEAAATTTPGGDAAHACAIAARLMSTGALSASIAPHVFATALGRLPTSPLAFQLTACALRWVPDLPEPFLIAAWRAGAAMAGSDTAASSAVGALPAAFGASLAADASLGLVLWTAMVAAAPRNDVFLEQALTVLPVEEALLLLQSLRQVLQLRTSAPVGSVCDAAVTAMASGQPAALCLPSLGQIVDWLRMVLDAHFVRLARAGHAATAADGAAAVRQLLAGLATEVTSLTGVAEVGASVRTKILQLASGSAAPAPVEPDHTVDALTIFLT